MLIQLFGDTTDFLYRTFYSAADEGVDASVISSSSSELIIENDESGYRAIFTGSGLSNPEVSLTGSFTSLEILNDSGDAVALFSDFTWSFEDFILALIADYEDGNSAPLEALLNMQPITLDASASSLAIDAPLEGLATDTTQIGSDFDDLLVGGSGADEIHGGDGDDSLFGESGNDSLYGGDGSDELFGGAGSDYINPGANTDYDFILGGAGNDTIDFGDAETGFYDLWYGDLGGNVAVTIDGAAGTGSVNKFGLGTDTLLDVDNVLDETMTDGLGLYGSDGNDSFDITTADGQWVSVRGRAGNDAFIVSGDGTVRLDYRGADHGIVANLATGVISDDGYGDTDTLTGAIWELRGTDFTDDITGSASDESFILRAGDDTLDGGAGFDRVRYDRSGYDWVDVNLAAGTATVSWDGTVYSQELSNIEWVRGSDGDDTITGDAGANRIDGRDGDDQMNGGGGSDTFQGSAGDDTINGGAGVDHVWYDVAYADATITATGSGWEITIDGETDTLTNIEWLGFSDQTVNIGGLDTIYGTPGFDILEGTEESDIIDGLAANDFIDGLGGDDTIYGGQGNDSLLGRAGDDVILGGNNHDNIALHEGDDYADGGLGNDSIGGGDGDDTLYGGSGNDVIGGGTDDDFIDAGDDQDAASGGYGADTVMGGGGDDTLAGSFGHDYVDGGSGDDSMGGGLGNDTLVGLSGDDTIGAGEGDDQVFGGTGDDFLAGAEGNDTIFGGTGADTINSGAGDDMLYGGSFDNQADGATDIFVFNDLIGDGNDSVYGFEDGIDLIRLAGVGPGALSITNVDGGAQVEVGDTGFTLYVDGMTAGTLTSDDFIFV